MKVLFLLACVVIAISAFNFRRQTTSCTIPDNNSVTTCNDVGQNCTVSPVSIGNNAFLTLQCPYSAVCVADPGEPFGVCTTLLGGNCTDTAIQNGCGSIPSVSTRAECDAQTNLCSITEESLFAGDSCTDDAQCLGAMNCVAGSCEGLALNATCTESNECAYGMWCDPAATPNECRLQNGLGEVCTGDPSCAARRICDTSVTPNVCIDYQSKATDDNCAGNRYCRNGDFCNTFVTPAVCTNVFPTGFGMDCIDSSNCTVPQTCNCDGTNTKCSGFSENPETPCSSQTAAYRACLNMNSCKGGQSNGERVGTCARDRCYREYTCLLLCSPLACGRDMTALNDVCNPQPTDGGTGGTDGNDGNTGGTGTGSFTGNTGGTGNTAAASFNSKWLDIVV